MELTKKQVIKEVEQLDPKLKKDDEAFRVATILLAGLGVGPDVEKIAKFLDLPREEVEVYEKRLRDNGVWVGDKTACNWFDEETGGIEFWLDVSVALGFVEKKTETKN